MLLLGLSLAPLLALAQTGDASAVMPGDAPPALGEGQTEVRRVIIRNRLVIRIPVRPRRSEPTRFTLSEGPRCLDSEDILGARIAGRRSIDFVLRNREIVRMTTDRECPSLDFYGGFYVHPDDDRVCAGRDSIRTRMGSSCQIRQFQSLRAAPSGR